MKRCFQLLVFFIFLTGSAQNTELFKKANAAYGDGDYQQAVQWYSDILENGKESVAVHYNLGNAYYKLNRVGPSIYHYEKALQLDPGDADVLNNLEFAKNMTIDAMENSPSAGIYNIIDSQTALLTPNGWGWTAISCMLIFLAFFLAYYFSTRSVLKRLFFVVGILFLLSSITAAGIGTLKQNFRENQSFAVVFSEETEVRSEPNVKSAEIFLIHEGTKVKVTEDFQGWYEIELPNGTQGWIRDQAVRRL